MNRRVLVGIASIPERQHALEQVIASLARQADQICVSLNGYETRPEFLDAFANVTAAVRATSDGDAEKFAGVDDWDGYVAACDDDILYPPDYISRLVDGIDRYGRDSLVSFHGGRTHGWDGSHGAASVKRIRCLGNLLADDQDVNVLGTGTLGYHAAHVPVWRGVFTSPNMADVHLACHARTLGIGMVALAHKARWLRDICPPASPQIYESNRAGDGTARDTRVSRKAELDRLDWTALAASPRVRVSVATCERPHLLPTLIDDLEREARWVDIEVAVFEDPSDADYSDVRDRVEQNGWDWHRLGARCGKTDHWRLVNAELDQCRTSAATRFVFLPDDVRLIRHAVPRALATWERLDEPATLTLWRLKDHEGQPNWTGHVPVEREHAFEVFHVDGIYLCGRATLEFLGYEVPAISPRRLASSGVGRAMSLRLHAAGKRLYRVPASLAVPVAGEPSVMNPKARDRRYPGVAL